MTTSLPCEPVTYKPKKSPAGGAELRSEGRDLGKNLDEEYHEVPAGVKAELPPVPLPTLPPVPDFPLEVLPNGFRALVADAADRMKFPPAFAAVAMMVAFGSIVGRKLGIRLKQRDDWTEYGNVWGGLVGQPSTLKSPAMREALGPFKALQVAANDEHQDLLSTYTKELTAFKLKQDACKKAAIKALAKNPDADIDLAVEAPEKPVMRSYWTSDATAEKLGELLAENPNGLLVERDELSSLLLKLEDETQATARGLYLSGWSGKEGFRFDRIGRGTTTLPKFAISVIGGIQPGPLSRYVRAAFAGERADGLLQRFQLMVWPDVEAFQYVDRIPDKDAREAVKTIFQYADTFDAETIGRHDNYESDDPPFIHFSDEAQEIFREWYSDFMTERREAETAENSPIGAHFGKYPGLVGKLALIIHVADEPDRGEVSAETLLKALGWIQYLTPHAERVYYAVEHPETGAAALLLSRLKRGELPQKFSARDIYRKCWHGLTEAETVKQACQVLCDFGWLIGAKVEDGADRAGGRPSEPVYTLSPAVEVGK